MKVYLLELKFKKINFSTLFLGDALVNVKNINDFYTIKHISRESLDILTAANEPVALIVTIMLAQTGTKADIKLIYEHLTS